MDKERYLGAFGALENTKHTGELVIAGPDTRIKLMGRGLTDLENLSTIYGHTDNNKKISCFDCFVTSLPHPFFDSDDHFEKIEMLPNFTLIGEEHLDQNAAAIHEVQFKLNDTELLFQNKKKLWHDFQCKK